MIQKISILALTCIASVFSYFGGVYYSNEPPGGLEPENIPMFISFGFDDNRYKDGVDWVVEELFAGRYNNDGQNNPATFDGTPMVGSFYVIANADYPWSENPYDQEMPEDRPVTETWRHAYDQGFGVGNHTWTHNHNLYDLSGEDLMREIGFASRYMVNIMGMPRAHIYGFRTPYLAHSSGGESFAATRDIGVLYDCTVNNGLQGNRPAEWTRADFPGRMDEGWTAWNSFPTDNFWQYPNATYQTQEGGTFSDMGFDSGPNGWPGGATAQEMFNQMKWAIEYHYETNRAPIDLGLHSDYYSRVADEEGTPGEFTSTLEERREALIMLLDWIEAELPHARVVEKIDAIRWMTDPVALDDLSRQDELTFSEDNRSGVFATTQTITDQGGSTADIQGVHTLDVTVADEKDWGVDAYAGAKYPLIKSMEDVHSVRVVYTSDLPLRLVLVQDGLGMGSYGLGLPATFGEEQVVELPVVRDYFELPRPYESDAALDLSSVSEVAVVAEVFDTTMSGTFTSQIEFFGAGQLTDETGITDETGALTGAFNVEALDNSRLSLAVPHAGEYTISVYNYRGQQIKSLNKTLSAGISTMSLNSISSGTYVIRLQGENADHTARVRIQ
ncbi:MAG: T9SS type A sorting domain-containing protein [Fibrobacterota bacterium]